MKGIKSDIINFRDESNRKQFHNPKDLAISLSLEASELLENFQWKSSEEAIEKSFEDIKDELVAVLIYSILLTDQLEVDIEEVIFKKLEKNAKKYPVEKAYETREKYNEY